ncbi:MAG: citrate synthase/methylcitrate synthase [Anaerolineaceae bacterium]|nr:citrate synthase/methylcitrate synthase [Anaerolineaceae bacterium]MCB9101906.1 citrate synthase/methylcitrate synthase [Anaerolineales bacterium]
MSNPNSIKAGLDGVVAAETKLSRIDGQAGTLTIAGFPLQELATNASFEETVYLLWYARLPEAQELADFRQALAERRTLPEATMNLLEAAATANVSAIDALRMAASSLSLGAPDKNPGGNSERDALMVVAAFPTIVAAYWRRQQGQPPIAPRADLGHAANYLYMLFGEVPSPARTRGLETYLNTVVEHGFNASTFTARVIISTQSDMISAIVGALGALKGPLHGGAPGPALDMVFEIGAVDQAEAYIRQKIERGERLMGFGHRIYKVRDPRAEVLAAAARRFYQADGNMALYNLATGIEAIAVELLAEYKPGRNLQTNVEFYTALLLHGLGLTTELFTPTFAVGRVGGWTAHAFEQQREGRLIRPKAVYVGAEGLRWPEKEPVL